MLIDFDHVITREDKDILVANSGRLFAASESGITSVKLTWPPRIERRHNAPLQRSRWTTNLTSTAWSRETSR